VGNLLVETGYIINLSQLQLLFLESVLLLCYGHPLRPSSTHTLTLFFYAPFTTLAMNAHRKRAHRRQAFSGDPFDSTGGLIIKTTCPSHRSLYALHLRPLTALITYSHPRCYPQPPAVDG